MKEADSDPHLSPELWLVNGVLFSSVIIGEQSYWQWGWKFKQEQVCVFVLTHVVDGAQPQSHLPVLVLAEDDLPQPWTDLSPPDANIGPRHRPHHSSDARARGQRHLL